jgi:hypothetical protein
VLKNRVERARLTVDHALSTGGKDMAGSGVVQLAQHPPPRPYAPVARRQGWPVVRPGMKLRMSLPCSSIPR